MNGIVVTKTLGEYSRGLYSSDNPEFFTSVMEIESEPLGISSLMIAGSPPCLTE
jgi:hypothetical protein